MDPQHKRTPAADVPTQEASKSILTTVRGRPSLSGEGDSPTVQYRVPRRLKAVALARAQREGVSLSMLGRIALERFLEAS